MGVFLFFFFFLFLFLCSISDLFYLIPAVFLVALFLGSLYFLFSRVFYLPLDFMGGLFVLFLGCFFFILFLCITTHLPRICSGFFRLGREEKGKGGGGGHSKVLIL
jgi:hypothetical protein